MRAAQVGRPERLVVLPFENLGAPEDAYFAAGMTEEITSRLASVQGLGVISRTSAMEYTRRGKTVKEIGGELGVDYVLEGSVRWEHGAPNESRVRITPQLIRVADDTHVWADRYDRVLADVFAIQSEVAESVVRAMGVTLLPREQTALKGVSTNDLEAYDFYLRGLEMVNRSQDRQDQEGGIPMFQAAVDRDPRFAQALAQLARAHLVVYWLFLDRNQEHLDRGKDAVDRLAALGADLPDTHVARGYYAYASLQDFPRALEEFQAAHSLQPSNSEALLGMGLALRRLGRWEEAAARLSKLVELDPRNPKALWNYAGTCAILRRYAEADRVLGLALSLSPQAGHMWGNRAVLQIVWRGDVDKATALLAEAGRVPGLKDDLGLLALASFNVALIRRDYQGAMRQLEAEGRDAVSVPEFFLPIELLRGQVQALSGQPDLARRSFEGARRRLEALIRQDPDDARYHSSLGIAYAGLGRRDEALKAARRGVELKAASKNAPASLNRTENLALVYTMLGQQDEAIDQLDSLLSASGVWTTNGLRLDPRWDPLRSNPRFQALLSKYEVKP